MNKGRKILTVRNMNLIEKVSEKNDWEYTIKKEIVPISDTGRFAVQYRIVFYTRGPTPLRWITWDDIVSRERDKRVQKYYMARTSVGLEFWLTIMLIGLEKAQKKFGYK